MEHQLDRSKPYTQTGCESGYHKRESYRSSKGAVVPARCISSTTVYAESSKNMKARMTEKQKRRLMHIPSIRSLTRKNCPPGMTPRKAYVRRYTTPVRKAGITVHRKGVAYKVFPKSKSTYVEAKCVKTLFNGASKKTARFGPLRKGELTKLGYSSRYPDEQRHMALIKAVGAYGTLGVYRKLDAVVKLSSRTIPAASAIYAKDREWVKEMFGPLKAF